MSGGAGQSVAAYGGAALIRECPTCGRSFVPRQDYHVSCDACYRRGRGQSAAGSAAGFLTGRVPGIVLFDVVPRVPALIGLLLVLMAPV